MKVEYLPSFIKDLKAMKSTPSYAAVRKIAFEEIPHISKLQDVNGVKKLKSFDCAYRLRVGNYRRGFFFENETVTFARVLHRSKIYKLFP